MDLLSGIFEKLTLHELVARGEIMISMMGKNVYFLSVDGFMISFDYNEK